MSMGPGNPIISLLTVNTHVNGGLRATDCAPARFLPSASTTSIGEKASCESTNARPPRFWNRRLPMRPCRQPQVGVVQVAGPVPGFDCTWSELWRCWGRGKRGKPKAGQKPVCHLLCSPTPWKSSKRQARFPGFPELQRQGRMEKWQNQDQVSHLHRAPILSRKSNKPPCAGYCLDRRGVLRSHGSPLFFRPGSKLLLAGASPDSAD